MTPYKIKGKNNSQFTAYSSYAFNSAAGEELSCSEHPQEDTKNEQCLEMRDCAVSILHPAYPYTVFTAVWVHW